MFLFIILMIKHKMNQTKTRYSKNNAQTDMYHIASKYLITSSCSIFFYKILSYLNFL